MTIKYRTRLTGLVKLKFDNLPLIVYLIMLKYKKVEGEIKVKMKKFIQKMWRLNRTILNSGYNVALEYIKQEIDLKVLSYGTGKEFDTWKIPKSWELEEAYLIDLDTGEKLLDTSDNILHVVIGSLPFNSEIDKSKLIRHLYYDKKRPEFIPCVYKYFDNIDWGFCCTKKQYDRILRSQRFKVVIKTSYSDGELRIGEYTVKGKSPETIFILTHLDGPAQANDNLSGVAVSVEVAKMLSEKQTYYTYKFLYLPGSIGPMAYIYFNPDVIKKGVGAIILEMLGHNSDLTLQYSREGSHYLDKALYYVLSRRGKPFKEKEFTKIIYSGERVFNSPGIDIPTVTLSRTEVEGLPFYEYRTSGDTLDIIKEDKLEEAKDVVLELIDIIEKDYIPVRNYTGIPFISKYGLWVEWNPESNLRTNINSVLFSLDNNTSILEICRKFNLDFNEVYNFLNKMVEHKLLTKKPVVLKQD